LRCHCASEAPCHADVLVRLFCGSSMAGEEVVRSAAAPGISLGPVGRHSTETSLVGNFRDEQAVVAQRSGCRSTSSILRPYLSYERCSALPSGRLCLPTGRPAAYGKRGRQHLPFSSTAGLASPTCGAALCHRAGCGRLQGGLRRVRRGQQHPQASHPVRAMRRFAIAPEVSSYSAAISGCGQRQQHQQALRLLRVAPRHALEPDVVSYRAASCGRRSVSSTSRPGIACERCSARPSCGL